MLRAHVPSPQHHSPNVPLHEPHWLATDAGSSSTLPSSHRSNFQGEMDLICVSSLQRFPPYPASAWCVGRRCCRRRAGFVRVTGGRVEVASRGLRVGSSLARRDAAVHFGTSGCPPRAEGARGCQRVRRGCRSHGRRQVIYLCAFKLKTTCQTKLLR